MKPPVWKTFLKAGESIVDAEGCKITKLAGKSIRVVGDLSRIHIVGPRDTVVRYPPGQARLSFTSGSARP